MTLISGLRVALMRPKISATASSVPTLVQPLPASSSIPDTAQVATPRDAAETSTRSRNLINQILLESGGGGMANLWRWNGGVGMANLWRWNVLNPGFHLVSRSDLGMVARRENRGRCRPWR